MNVRHGEVWREGDSLIRVSVTPAYAEGGFSLRAPWDKRSPMWRRAACGLLFLASCMMAGPVERRKLADGSWQLTCRLPMDECVRHLEAICMDKRYRILAGQSKRELRDVEPGTREYRTSELTVLCDRDAADFAAAAAAASPSGPPPPGAPPLPPPPPAPAAAPRASCVPGAAQACVGPAGCNGGQACRADGSGFGPCDCGGAKAASGGDAGS
jgi:hypothetical protein